MEAYKELVDNDIIFTCKEKEVMKLTEQGMIYNGELIEDAGEAHKIFIEVMICMQKDKATENLKADFEELDDELTVTEKLLDSAYDDKIELKGRVKQLEVESKSMSHNNVAKNKIILQKVKEIAYLKDENEELADLVVKWEERYSNLKKKMSEIEQLMDII